MAWSAAHITAAGIICLQTVTGNTMTGSSAGLARLETCGVQRCIYVQALPPANMPTHSVHAELQAACTSTASNLLAHL